MGEKRQHIPLKMRLQIAGVIKTAAEIENNRGIGFEVLAGHINTILDISVSQSAAWRIATEIDLDDYFRARSKKKTPKANDEILVELQRLKNNVDSTHHYAQNLEVEIGDLARDQETQDEKHRAEIKELQATISEIAGCVTAMQKRFKMPRNELLLALASSGSSVNSN